MRRRPRALAALAAVIPAVIAAAPAPATAGTGRVLVTLRPEAARTAASAAAPVAAAGGRRDGPLVPQVRLVTARPGAGESVATLLRRLRRDPRVAAASPEGRFAFRDVPDDPALSDPERAAGTPAGTPVQWTLAREGLYRAWNVTTGRGALVGLIDSGVDASHPDLAGKVATAVDQDRSPFDGGPRTDEQGHGTHVGSLACAATGNGRGIAGAGRDCRLVVEKSDLSESSIVAALVDATDRGVQAINMSFGGTAAASTALRSALRYADRRNVVLVAAAADSPTSDQGSPARDVVPSGSGPRLGAGLGLTVTAASARDARASFAGFGSQVSLAAYGVFDDAGTGGPGGLLGAFPAGRTTLESGLGFPPAEPCECRASFRGDGRYAYLSGTSMAAPQVAAVAATLRALNPGLTARDVISTLERTARRAGGWDAQLGWGILDAGAAVSAARRIDRTPPVSSLAVRSARARRVAVRLTGRDPRRRGLIVSGVARFEIFATRAGRAARVLARTRSRTARVTLPGPGTWRLGVRAVDRAGNRERGRRPTRVVRVA